MRHILRLFPQRPSSDVPQIGDRIGRIGRTGRISAKFVDPVPYSGIASKKRDQGWWSLLKDAAVEAEVEVDARDEQSEMETETGTKEAERSR